VAAGLSHRLATIDDIPALKAVMAASIAELQRGFLTDAQIAASRAFMGLDTQLIADGTYFVVEADGRIAGCGGWSRRATPYGGDHTPDRDPRVLDPGTEAARVRAMYTHPNFARRGVGRLILQLCEAAAAAEGFTHLEMAATLAGRELYARCGYAPIETIVDARGGEPVPLIRMGKRL
jgi:GNAT superfamily N-acetyltransferase